MGNAVNLIIVHRDMVDSMWPKVLPFIMAAYERGGGVPDMTPEHLLSLIRFGRVYLLVAKSLSGEVTGAAAVEFVNYPMFRAAQIIAIGGRHLVSDPWLMQEFRAWLYRNEVTKLEALCRPAVARLLRRIGMKESTVFVRGDV